MLAGRRRLEGAGREGVGPAGQVAAGQEAAGQEAWPCAWPEREKERGCVCLERERTEERELDVFHTLEHPVFYCKHLYI
jgi:hypothetical protein